MSFSFPQKVLFKHCDPAGIVFFPRYFEMMNDCVEAFFDTLGHPFEKMHGGEGGVPTGRIEARFHAPSRHGDHLLLTLRGQRIGRASFDFTIETVANDEQRMSYAATLVHIDGNGKSKSWPDALRAELTKHITSET